MFLDRNQIPYDDLDDDDDLHDNDYTSSKYRHDSHDDESDYTSDNDDEDDASDYGDDDEYDDHSHHDDHADNDSYDDDSDSNYRPMSDLDNEFYYSYDSSDTDPDDWTPIGITGVKPEHTQDANIAQQQIEDDNYYPPEFYNDIDDNNNDYLPPESAGVGSDDVPPESAGVGSENNSDEPPESAGVGTYPHHDGPPESTGVESQDELNKQEELDRNMDTRYGLCTERYNMRQWKERNYSHLFVEMVDDEDADDTQVDDEDADDTQEFQTPQMSMKRGIKLFREDGVSAIHKEMQQLHDWKVMAAEHSGELTPEQKKEALAYPSVKKNPLIYMGI